MTTPVITHAFNSPDPQGTDPNRVYGPQWNAGHVISGFATSATTDTTNASNITSGTLAVAQGGTGLSGLGTGVATALGINVGINGAFVVRGGDAGTPSAQGLVNSTGLPISTGLTGAGTGVLTALGVNIGSAGAFTTFNGAHGTPSSITLTSATGLPVSTGITGAGTGVLTALAVNVGTAGSFVVNGGALGSPSSAGTLPAHTLGGTVAGGGNQLNNIIVGTSTPLAGTFTTLTGNTSVSSPIHTAAGALQFQSNGSTFAGNIDTSQRWSIGTNTAVSNGSSMTISRNTAALPTAPGFTAILSLAAADANNTDFVLFGFGTGKFAASRYLQARGTAAAPTATQSGDNIGGSFAYGANTSAGLSFTPDAGFIMVATDNHTNVLTGARLDLYATATGTSALAVGASVGAGLMLGDTVDPGAGALSATASIKSKGATSGIGYAIGAGGTVTQGTSRTTGVTLNKVCGSITLFSQVNSAVSQATAQSFTLTNSAIAATDVVHVTQQSGTDKYEIFVSATAAGSCQITNYSTGGTTNEAPVFNFVVIKGVTS